MDTEDTFTSIQWDREEDLNKETPKPIKSNTVEAIGEEDELAESGLLQSGIAELSVADDKPQKESDKSEQDTDSKTKDVKIDYGKINETDKTPLHTVDIPKDDDEDDFSNLITGNDTVPEDNDDEQDELVIGINGVPKMTTTAPKEVQEPTINKPSLEGNQQASNNDQSQGTNNKASLPDYHIGKDDFFIQTRVSAPLTEYDGQNPFTSYLIETKTNHPQLKLKSLKVRRRYSDFDFLYDCLTNDYPTLIIPPLPNKQRLEYIKGSRFTEEFTLKRTVSLENFLSRLCSHPILKHSQLFHVFLEDSGYWLTYKQNLKISNNGIGEESASQNLESVSDYIMNAFKKPKVESKHNKEFQEIYDRSNRLQGNLVKIDTIYTKLLKKQNDIADDFSAFSSECSKLGLLLANDFSGTKTDKSVECSKEITDQITIFSDNTKKMSERLYILIHDIEYNYLTSLKDLEHYINQLKNLIKLKESKSIDYDMLGSYLEKAIHEKQHLMNGGSVTSTAEGALSFFSKKLEAISPFGSGSHNSGDLTRERIQKLTSRIEMLEKEKKTALEVIDRYETDLLKEYQHFEKVKTDEINGSLRNLQDSYLQYFTNLLNDWKFMKIDGGENLNTENTVTNVLSDDNKLFTHNDVLENNEILNDKLKKLKEAESKADSSDHLL